MTQEEKARAYDEALGRAKKLYSEAKANEYASDMQDYEFIFPELRESEEEMVRKELVNFLQSPFIKENLADEKVAPWLAYLEKQKEHPKSADSIPSDCASDAKCEDRWHKVGYSFPDNPREVLCKDEAGNYFIGRYYVGEGWEISNYDDEDKPHHLNPPVSKWIDFPSEKQKEQKPADVKDPFSNANFVRGYESGYNDAIREQKPVEWDDYTKTNLDRALQIIKKAKGNLQGYQSDDGIYECDKAIECLEHFLYRGLEIEKPAEWSEEDKRAISRACVALRAYANGELPEFLPSELIGCADRLQSLRPSWKPSEEQMVALEECGECKRCIKELYEQLKSIQ